MVPKRSNSGVYVMGEYEIQVLDSYGKERVGPGDIGGIYGAAAPKKNASKKPGEWQKFVIDFQAPQIRRRQKSGQREVRQDHAQRRSDPRERGDERRDADGRDRQGSRDGSVDVPRRPRARWRSGTSSHAEEIGMTNGEAE